MPIVQTSGDGAQGSVLLVHGTPGDRRFFQKLAPLLPGGRRVALMDLPDHGDAPDLPSLDLTPFDEDLAQCVASLPAPVTLVGHSFGGYLVARLLGDAHPSIERAVFIAAFASLPADLAAGRARIADAFESGALTTEGLATLAVDLFLGGEGQPEDEAVIRAMMRDTPPARMLRAIRRVAMVGSLPPPRRFTTPALVVHAKEDPALPHALSIELAAHGEHARLLSLAGRSHCPQMTNVKDLVDAVF